MTWTSGPVGTTWDWLLTDAERVGHRRAVERMRHLSSAQGQVRVAVSATVAAPAGTVWEVMTDAARGTELLDDPVVVACVVPGTPEDAVGELTFVAVRPPDGTVFAHVAETVVREPGQRLVARSRVFPLVHSSDWTIRPVAADRCTVTLVSTLSVPRGTGVLFRGALRRAGLRALWQVRRVSGDHTVVDEPQPELPRAERRHRRRALARAEALAAGPRQTATAARTAVLPAPVDAVWPVVRATGSPVVERGDPTAFCFVPSGDPLDAPGTVRAVLGRHPTNDLEAPVEEVVAVLSAARLVTRDLTAFGPRAEVTLGPAPGGCRIDVRLSQETLQRDAARTGALLDRRARAYLDRVGRASTGMPALSLEESWVG